MLKSSKISLSPFLLALSVVLLRHYAALHEQCTDKQDCKFTRHARGTFGFCIGPAIFGLIEGGVGLFATFTTSVAVPPILTVVLDNVAGGFFMSGGTVSRPCPLFQTSRVRWRDRPADVTFADHSSNARRPPLPPKEGIRFRDVRADLHHDGSLLYGYPTGVRNELLGMVCTGSI